MGPWGFGLTPLEGSAPPEFGVAAFESRPLFPSQTWTACHPPEGDAPASCADAASVWTDVWFTNHIAQAVIGAALVIGFWLVVTRRPAVVPGKRQFLGEYAYNLIRNGVARDIVGPGFEKYVPYLLALFSFILVNNLFGQTFLFMFPTFSKIGFAWGLAIASWVLYNAAGVKKHGFVKYFSNMTMPHGVPKPLLLLVAPLEFISNFVTRPLTLGLRLFANLFAGHLVVMVFVVGGSWLLLSTPHSSGGYSPIWNVAGGLAILMSFFVFAIELLVACLQAYIFTVLTAQYVSSSLAEEH
ncbi:MAG: F0F1 ATP synthase subunit A [Propionibacteriaceae bacterium]|jgi:F-type H+-transporting ATPase subunit a|nr:F0F1 ATP synthase subunit A [Propionibacteriaceae bacterium]